MLAADVAGYSRLMRADESGTLAELKAHRSAVFEPAIAEHGGRIVKLMGDGLLAEFASILDAALCAVAMQRALAERNAALPAERRMLFRMGLNLGDVLIEGEDIYGDGVNVAARLEALAEPGGIAISEPVHQQVSGKIDLAFEDKGTRRVKNLPDPIRVYCANPATDPGSAAQDSDGPASREDGGAGDGLPAIAVLPFANMSGDPEQDYFSDGISEDIITELSRFRSLRVIARNSAFTYKGRAVRAEEVGRDLGVAYMVEGSVRKSGHRVRVTAQLIETASGKHLWAERYDRELEDLFDLQDEITRAVAAAVEPELGRVELARARQKPPENLSAWDRYQRGLWHSYKDTKADNAAALRELRQAIALSPDFAPPYAVAAEVLFQEVIGGYRHFAGQSVDEAVALAETAVALDDKDALGHTVLGRMKLLQCRHEESLAALEAAVALNPSYADAHHGLGFSLIFSGRPAEAVPRFETSIRLSPYDPRISSFHEMKAWALLVMGRYDAALAPASSAVRRPNAQFWAHATYTAALGHLGRREEAAAARGELLRRNPDFSADFVRRAVYYEKVPEQLERYIEGLEKAGVG